MTKKETIKMLREMLKDLDEKIENSWWEKEEIKTLTSAINFLEGIKK